MDRIVWSGLVAVLVFGTVETAAAQVNRRIVTVAESGYVAVGHRDHSTLLDEPARLDVEDVSIGTSLLELQRRSGIPVAYSPSLLPAGRRVTCECIDVTVGEALGRILAGTGLGYAEYGGQVLIEIDRPAPPLQNVSTVRLVSLDPAVRDAARTPRRALRPQRFRIGGVVVNEQNGAPIAGAEVSLAGSDRAAVTDKQGRFELSALRAGVQRVEVRKSGYRRLSDAVRPSREAVVLEMDPSLFGRRVGTITGQVTAEATGEPLPGVQVFLEGTSLGALTQDNGRYLIQDVPDGIYAVVARFIGYADGRADNVEVTGAGTAVVDFALSTQILTLEEVVVTGVADPIEGVKLPFSVGRISGENISSVPTTGSAASALQGKVAGVSVIRASGQPGSGSYILLRTPTSIEQDNSPLFVVDGIPMGSTFSGTTADLATMDIESIEVVKGAAAASLYGSRAANGVVQIRTKRGSGVAEGETRFELRTEYGVSQAPQGYPLATHHNFATNAQGEWLDGGGNVTNDLEERVVDGVGIMDNAYGIPIYNNIESFYQPGRFLRTSLSIAQNSRNTNFLLSFENHNDRGALENNEGYWRRGARLNLDHRIGTNVSLGATVYHSRSWQDELSGGGSGREGGIFWDLLMYPPEVDLGKKGPDGNYLQAPDPNIPQENPIWRQATRDNFEERARTQASMSARFSPLGWLTFTGLASYDRAAIQEQVYVPKGTPLSITQDQPSDGRFFRSDRTVNTYNTSFGANLLHRFGDLTARLNVLGTMEREENRYIDADGQDLLVVSVPDIGVARDQAGSSSYEEIRGNGYYGQLGLDYAGKYIGDFLVRRDGSSLFGPEARWQTYYRGSAAYLLSEEPWWPFPALNLFKVRYAIGTAGGRPEFEDRYETWGVDGETGLVSKGTLGNRALKPARKTEQEMGIDLIAWDRYSLILSYVTQTTEDQLITLVIPAVTGYGSQVGNAGTQKGTTYEATLEAVLLNTPDFTWSTTVVADRSRSEITEFGRSCYIDGMQKICPGSSLSDIWGEQLMTSVDQLPAIHAGSLDAFEINDDGWLVPVGAGNSYENGLSKGLWGTQVVIDGVSYPWGHPILIRDSIGVPVIGQIGSSLPDLNLGWMNNVRWKNLTMHVAMQAQIGGEVYNGTKQRLYQHTRHGDLDQSGKPDELKKPSEYYYTIYNRMNRTNAFLEPGWFVKVREVSLLYNFDRQQLARIGLGWLGSDRISLGLIGRNLLSIDDYSGYDPEVGTILNRFDYFRWPLTRQFTGTVEITF